MNFASWHTNHAGQTITNWPGETSALYVGERFAVCIFLDLWGAVLTNINWLIPCAGNAITSYTIGSTFGGPVPFAYGLDSTGAILSCHFTSSFTNEAISVTASFMGEIISLCATVSVHNPTALLTAEIGTPACDTNHFAFSGRHGLHLGGATNSYESGGFKMFNCNPNDHSRDIGTFFFCQVAHFFDYRKVAQVGTNLFNLYMGSTNICMDSGTVAPQLNCLTSQTAPFCLGVRTHDAPWIIAEQDDFILSMHAGFTTYLMWYSNRPDSSPISVASVPWGVNATGNKVLDWELDSAATSALGSIVPANDLPSWQENGKRLLDLGWQLIP